MKRLRTVIIFLFITWVLGEILSRIFIPLDPQKRSWDRTFQHPFIRTEWVPGFQTTYVIEGIAGQKGTMKLEINPFGFRSSSMKTVKKPLKTSRVFFLGGSTTEEIYLPEEKTFPFLVEKKLAQKFPDRKFECVNGGISGYLAADTLALLIYKVMYYEPDLVVVMLGINDLRYGTFASYDPIERANYQKILYKPNFGESPWNLLVRFFKQSHFLTLIKWRILNRFFPPEAEKYKTKLEEYGSWRKVRSGKPFSVVSESRALPDFIKYLSEMIFVTRGHGVPVVFMTEASIYQKNISPEIENQLWMGYLPEGGVNLSTEFLFQEMNRFNDAVRKLARDYDVELIDLEKEIPKTLIYFYDDVHLTPEGAERASEVISTYLRERSFS